MSISPPPKSDRNAGNPCPTAISTSHAQRPTPISMLNNNLHIPRPTPISMPNADHHTQHRSPPHTDLQREREKRNNEFAWFSLSNVFCLVSFSLSLCLLGEFFSVTLFFFSKFFLLSFSWCCA